jgi:hypothetical protein
MTITTIHVPAVAHEPLLDRARNRYGQLDDGLLEQLVATAASSVQERGFADERSREIAAHVTVARLAGSHIARIDRTRLLGGPVAIVADPPELALSQHVHGRLTPEELLATALLVTRRLPPRLCARALNLTVGELHELERSGREKARELTLAYHEDLICEPAALAHADRPALRAAAVREHLASCRSCRSELEDRVRVVLAHAGALVDPLPPLDAYGPAGDATRRLVPRPRLRREARAQAHAPAP